jgi:phage portal protein BeeE
MNFALSLKSVSPYAGTAGSIMAGGQGTVDYFRRDISPSPLMLVRENLSTAYACSSLNAELIAKTRLRLYIKTRKGEGGSRLKKYGRTKAVTDEGWRHLQKNIGNTVGDAEELDEVTDHPALNLIEKPNPRGSQNDGCGMSLFTLLEATQLYQETVGRAYWYCGQRNETKVGGRSVGSVPSQIWVLAPQFVTEWPGVGDDAPIIEYYQFALGTGKLSNYPPKEVVPFRMTDMATGGYSGGMSPLRACFEQARLLRFADGLTSARVQNGGRPDAVFTPTGDEFGGSLGRDESARLESLLRTRYRMAGAGSMIVADIPGTITPITWPMNDVLDAARYNLGRELIAEVYHVPMTKLKRDSANRASAESGEFAHALDAGLPRLRRDEAALNTFYTPMFGDEAAERLFFAFDDPPGLTDSEDTKAKFTLAVNRGFVTGNEVRKQIGAKEVGPQLDQYLVPSTVVALNPDGTPNKPAPAAPGGIGAPKPETPGEEVHDEDHPIDPSGAVNERGKPVRLPKPKRVNRLAKAIEALASLLKPSIAVPVIHVHNGPTAPEPKAIVTPRIDPDESGHKPIPEFAPPQPPAPHLENALKRVFRDQREAVLAAIDRIPDDEVGKWFRGVNGNGKR